MSLAAKLLVLILPSLATSAVVTFAGGRFGLSAALSIFAGVSAGLLVATVTVSSALRGPSRILDALQTGLDGLRSHDYSLRLVQDRGDELGQMVSVFNQLSDLLAQERGDLRRREILLQTVIETSPAAVLLVNASGRVLIANHAARVLFHHGRRLVGTAFEHILEGCPPAFRDALEQGRDTLVSLELNGEDEVFHITRRIFDLNTRRHLLISVRRMSSELRRQEVAIWKKVIRVIAHELNNSLAPVRSMVHSARLLRGQGADDRRLDEILEHIDESAASMHRFVDGYRQFARMPEPRRRVIPLGELVEPLRAGHAFRLEGPAGAEELDLEIDPGQARQALLNLLQNAHQAGGPEEEVVLRVEIGHDGKIWLRVLDRGRGMDEETLGKALLPFYSSRKDGTGLGLALSREIVEAHGGRLGLALRPSGGLEVSTSWPRPSDDSAP